MEEARGREAGEAAADMMGPQQQADSRRRRWVDVMRVGPAQTARTRNGLEGPGRSGSQDGAAAVSLAGMVQVGERDDLRQAVGG